MSVRYRQFFFKDLFLHGKNMKIIQNTLKIEKKISDVSKKFRVGPKKEGMVGFPEIIHFFALCIWTFIGI